MQIFAQVVSIAIAIVGIALFARAISKILGVVRIGQPANRTNDPGARAVTLVKETLGHTRMLQWKWVGIGHWFVFAGFGLLFFTLITAFGQLFNAHFALPLIGHWFLFEWVSELFTLVMIVAIVVFIGYRVTRPKERTRGTDGRFFGSTMWQAYFVEMVILGVGLCITVLRGLEYALMEVSGEHASNASAFHFPFSFPIGELFSGLSEGTLKNLIYLVAMLKIVISFVWMITISLTPTMGVAWHRFLAFFNIYLKREATGGTALGALAPMTSGGEVLNFEDLEDMDEDTKLGVGAVEDFSWKGILDFSTCTECGRCQSQCPAWNTEKPLSPKLMVMALRDHAHAKAPYVQAAEGDRAALLEGNPALALEAERPLVGDTGDDWFYNPDSGAAVIDPDVLWSCTSCGACVQQCPVDIEHVDHIVDMRRYQILVESNFPAELNGLFKGLENKGNPWNMSPTARMDWAKGLDFDVKVVGEDVESLDEVDWLFWVGCAGAYEDRAKKTTRAVAELLNMAGVDFAVLGNGETCTGDPARRAGNEFVFQGLAAQNAEVFKETKVKKVVSTCAHCFNTLKNEYAAFGVELEVVHHTQLLNRLVREKKLTPVAAQGGSRSITYHDPCYLGRHNQVYSPPRELLQVIPGAELKEMPRNSERSFCCGAGGARMWMEETIGERINVNRTKEAVETGADQIAVGCPFCRVMLSDGLTAEQAAGNAREEVEVLDVAQLLLASVKGESASKKAPAAKAAPAAAAPAAAAAAAVVDEAPAPAAPAASGGSLFDDAAPAASSGGSLFDDPAPAAPAASATSGGSLFDDPAPAAPAASGGSLFDVADSAPAAEAAPAASGGSLFDIADSAPAAEAAPAASGGSLFDIAEEPAATAAPAAPAAEPAADSFAGGSLFDVAGDEPAAPAAAPAAPAAPADSIPQGGSLFDIAAPAEPEPATPAAPAAPKAEPAAPAASSIPETGSLFDIEAPAEPKPVAKASAPAAPASAPAPAAPASSIPETGSLFDIEAPAEPEPVVQAAPVAEPEAPVAEPEAEAAPAEAEPEKPKPASNGEAHQPRTDGNIDGAGSLFDL